MILLNLVCKIIILIDSVLESIYLRNFILVTQLLVIFAKYPNNIEILLFFTVFTDQRTLETLYRFNQHIALAYEGFIK